QRSVNWTPRNPESLIGDVYPSLYAKPILTGRWNLILFGPHLRPPHVHSHLTFRHLKSPADVDSFFRAHRQLVNCVDDLNPIQPVDHSDLASKAFTARRIGFNQQ